MEPHISLEPYISIYFNEAIWADCWLESLHTHRGLIFSSCICAFQMVYDHRVLCWRDSKVLIRNSGNLAGKIPFWLHLGNLKFLLKWTWSDSNVLIVESFLDKDRMSITALFHLPIWYEPQNPCDSGVFIQSNNVSWFRWPENIEKKDQNGKLPYNKLALQGSNIIKTVH